MLVLPMVVPLILLGLGVVAVFGVLLALALAQLGDR